MKHIKTNITKNALSLFLCFTLLFLLLPFSASAADTTKDVTTYSDITDVLETAVSGDNIVFNLKNSIVLGATGVPSINIPAGVNVTITNASGVDATVTRNSNVSTSLSRIDINGSLTIKSGDTGSVTFDGKSFNFKRDTQFAVTGVGSRLTIESGTFINHSSYFGTISSTDGATTTINGGTFQYNKNMDLFYGNAQGGVIWAANSNLTINSGTFSNNTAGSIGGVIFYEGRTSENKLLVNGGTFSNNAAYGGFGGGAIFIDCALADEHGTYESVAELNAGTFTGNSAPNGFGGAIYIQLGSEVKMSNSYISGNSAKLDGGGVWNCPTGGGDYYTFHGMYLASNTADSDGDDFYSMKKAIDTRIYLTDYAATGEKINWKYDDTADTATLGQTAPNSYYQYSSEIIALKSSLSEYESPESQFDLIFTGNTAGQSGGAIANNGEFQVGEATSLSVQKETTVSTAESFNFKVSLTRDGEGMPGSFVYIDTDSDSPGTIQFGSDGTSTLSLKAGQTISLLDLPAGASFVVTEISLPDGWKLQSENNQSGTISPEAEEAPQLETLFTNAPVIYGGLTVSKTVTGDGADKEKAFTFTVTLSDTSVDGVRDGMTFNDGIATFTLKNGESKTASKLPAGTGYTVTESGNSDYTVTVTGTGASGTIPENSQATAAFNNRYKSGGSGDEGSDTGVTPSPSPDNAQAGSTGDTTPLVFWLAVAALAIVGIVITLFVKKRSHKRR